MIEQNFSNDKFYISRIHKTFIPLKNSKNSLKENIIKNKTIWVVSWPQWSHPNPTNPPPKGRPPKSATVRVYCMCVYNMYVNCKNHLKGHTHINRLLQTDLAIPFHFWVWISPTYFGIDINQINQIIHRLLRIY